MSRISDVLGYWLRRSGLASTEIFVRHFAELDLTMLQFGILIVVDEKPGISQKEITKILGAKPSVLVKPLDRLERRGLIVRNRAAPDRRLQSVSLTDSGKDLAAQGYATSEKLQAVLLRNIEPGHRKILFECLSRIVVNVEQYR